MNNDNLRSFNLKKIDQELYNNTQQIVLEILEDFLSKPQFEHVCTCEKCLKDMAAFALNRLPAKYIPNSEGGLHTKILEFENRVHLDAHKIIEKAIKVVSKNPRHS